jgi:hypothetical protein
MRPLVRGRFSRLISEAELTVFLLLTSPPSSPAWMLTSKRWKLKRQTSQDPNQFKRIKGRNSAGKIGGCLILVFLKNLKQQVL